MIKKLPLDKTFHFDQEGFSGDVYVSAQDKMGFNALRVTVHGHHPKKRILDGNTRVYLVISGTGEFILNGEKHLVNENDMFIIPAGGEYEYAGEMKLFEFNISPDNSFRDERI